MKKVKLSIIVLLILVIGLSSIATAAFAQGITTDNLAYNANIIINGEIITASTPYLNEEEIYYVDNCRWCYNNNPFIDYWV